MPFLARLLGCSAADAWRKPITVQTFDDVKLGGDGRPELSRVFHDSLAQLAPELERLSQAGAGIFITVNGTDGKGRRKLNIRACRAWFSDLDTKDALKPYDPACGLLEPSMVIKTPGGYHLYFLTVEAVTFEDAAQQAAYESDLKRIQAHLAGYGADPMVCDVGRVLRFPGFMHRKAEPRMVELVKVDGPRYTLRQIREAFPRVEAKGKPGGAPLAILRAPGRPENWRERVAAFLQSCEPSIQGSNGSRALFTTCMKLYTRFGLTVEEVVELVMVHYNVPGRCVPLWSMAEAQHKAASAQLATGPARGGAWLEGRRHG